MNAQAATVSYAVLPDGYKVTVWDSEVQPLHEYAAGNHPLSSADYLAADDPRRVKRPTLGKWARQTALELADEWGVAPSKIWRDHDDEQDALQDATRRKLEESAHG